MSDKRMRVVMGVFAICLADPAFAGEPDLIGQSLEEAWRGASAIAYVTPEGKDVEEMRGLFVRLLRGERDRDIGARLRDMGWSLRTQSSGGRTWTVVSEEEGRRSGRGLFAIGSQGRHALQAPHVPSDGLTGLILLRYAEDGLPRALAWNTLPRSKADMAHREDTYFMVFSQAYAVVFPDEKILQIHGFDTARRRSASAEQSSAIVSAAHGNPPRALRTAVDCLKQRVDPGIQLYGRDVAELGGTTNSIAKQLRRHDYEGFVHVELSLPLRETLRDDMGKRLALFECLGGPR